MATVQLKRKPELVERRRAERYDIHAPVHLSEIRILRMERLKQVLETRDISSEGAYLWTEHPLRPGAKVMVDVFLCFDVLRRLFGDDRHLIINLRGRIVRAEGDGMAVRFGRWYQLSMM